MTRLTGQQVADAGLDGWALLLDALHTRVRTRDFATGLALVAAVGAVAEEVDHHPDLDLRYAHVDVRLRSHDARGVTERDVALARRVAAVAADLGVELEARTVALLELALDSPDRAAVLPFWRAVLAMDAAPAPGVDDEVRDPYRVLPNLWFQPSGSEEPRQHWHPDLWLPPEQVQPRIDAAVAAGGTLVSDAHAPSYWVLADAEGNRVCLCTWQERG